jgi:uncharacterized protein YllA (UPF0747 family)
MDRYHLSLTDLFQGETALQERVASRLVPPALARRMSESREGVEAAVRRLREDLTAFDGSLADALDRSARKIAYQMGKMETKTSREIMRRDEHAARDAQYLAGLVFPERHLQERLYSILPFLAKHGLDLPGTLYDGIELECSDHRVMVL